MIIAPGGCGGNFLAQLIEGDCHKTESNEYIFCRWKPYSTTNKSGEQTGSPDSNIILLHNDKYTFGFESKTNNLNEKIISLETEYALEIDEVIIIRYNSNISEYVHTLNELKGNKNVEYFMTNVSDESISSSPIKTIVIDYKSFFIDGKGTGTYLDKFLPEVRRYTLRNQQLIKDFKK